MPGFFVRKGVLTELKKINHCAYCGTYDNSLHIEHIYPRSLGGGNTKDNLTIACGLCNSLKGTFTVGEFLHRVFDKRDFVMNKCYSFLDRARNSKKRHGDTDYKNYITYLDKALWYKQKHSYYTAIIHSITLEKYMIKS